MTRPHHVGPEGAFEMARERDLLRHRDGHAHGKVSFVELFFDLVFVFAVTQLSHCCGRRSWRALAEDVADGIRVAHCVIRQSL